MKILVVEDEEALAKGLKFNFEQEGYGVDVATDGAEAVAIFERSRDPFDLIVLDLMLPGMSGYEVCQSIRATDRRVPILVLSARTLSQDKAQAFDAGTDQYMTKPFALPELLSRVRNLLDRHGNGQTDEPSADSTDETPDLYEFGNVRVNLATFEVTVGDETHSLTTTEFQLLRYFVEHKGIVLSRHQILRDVWGQDADVTTRTIDNFVMRLRRLVEDDPANPRHIVSVRGTGYRFLETFCDATYDVENT